MKISIIDIGSNSVRLMLWADGNTLYKKIRTTRLGEGLSLTGIINDNAMARTVDAVVSFYNDALLEKCDKIYAFATAAVRRAENGDKFVCAVKNSCGLSVDVISGELEAKIGYLGALEGKNGGILDIGGASSELIVGEGGNIIFSKSIDVGTVRLKDLCGDCEEKLNNVIDEKISQFKNIPPCDLYAIGGTATTLVSLYKKLKVYDPEKVHGTSLTINDVFNLSKTLLFSTLEQRLNMLGMEKGRADVIGGGALLMYKIMQKVGVNSIIVSEKDNLEGYALYKKAEGEI